MEIWSKKEEDDENNKKEENRLQTAISPTVVGCIFVGGAQHRCKVRIIYEWWKVGVIHSKTLKVEIILNNFSKKNNDTLKPPHTN